MMNKVVKMGKKLVEKAIIAKGWLLCAGMCAMVEMNSAVCYAKNKTKSTPKPEIKSGTEVGNEITEKFVNLENLVLAIIGAAGVIYLAKSVYEFASAYQSSDSSGTNAAVKGILGALMMIFIDVIIAFLKK